MQWAAIHSATEGAAGLTLRNSIRVHSTAKQAVGNRREAGEETVQLSVYASCHSPETEGTGDDTSQPVELGKPTTMGYVKSEP